MEATGSTRSGRAATPSPSTDLSSTARLNSSAMYGMIPSEIVFTHLSQVSGGHLAVLDTAEESDWLRRHLVKHVASNICEKNIAKVVEQVLVHYTILKSLYLKESYFHKLLNLTDPYETVTFFIGGFIDEV